MHCLNAVGCNRRAAWLAIGLLLAGCGGPYFRKVESPPVYALQAEADRWPYTEYWSGIVFNGNRIGFSHLTFHRQAANRFAIRSEAAFALHFLGISKQIELHALDIVDARLHLVRFDYAYTIDHSRMEVRGKVEGHRLRAEVHTAGHSEQQEIRLQDAVYPGSATLLYPLLHGLRPGARFAYTVYSGELQRLETVHQQVQGIETSSLYDGPAFRLLTRMHGQKTTTWIGMRGRPLLEIGGHGILISYLETEHRARRYLALASLNKQDVLIGFSLIPTQPPIKHPEQVRQLRVRFSGMPASFTLPESSRQHCTTKGHVRICEISPGRPPAGTDRPPGPRDLAPSPSVQSDNPRIRRLAAAIATDKTAPGARVRAILHWIDKHIRDRAVDTFSALDVLRGKAAECQGQTYLYLALARASGIPSRMANGLVYSARYKGFAYHSWAESWVHGRWISVDPILGQAPADATHIKLLEGETLADLLPLTNLIGRLKAYVEASSR